MWLRMDGADADNSNTEKLVADPKSSPSWVSQVIPTNGCNNAAL
jgi:hypothetical protein